jgi:predicted TIM-barrel fold metal-dependent hydrolase
MSVKSRAREWAESRAAASKTSGRIDVHAHLIPDFYRQALAEKGITTSGGFPIPSWSPAMAIEFMDRYGIQAQVLSVSEPGVSFLSGAPAVALAQRVNDYSAALIQAQPTRFSALGVLPMPDVAASITELRRCLGPLGLEGVVLQSSYDGVYLGDSRFEPLLAELNRSGVYVFVHPSAPPAENKPAGTLPDFLYEFTFDTTRAVTTLVLSGAFRRYPKIRWQLAHAGGTIPFLEHRLERLSQQIAQVSSQPLRRQTAPTLKRSELRAVLAGLYYDTGLSSSAPSMAATLKVTPLEHVLFGTDWPFAGLTFRGSGDPQPDLNRTLSGPQRAAVERSSPLAQFPRLARALGATR